MTRDGKKNEKAPIAQAKNESRSPIRPGGLSARLVYSILITVVKWRQVRKACSLRKHPLQREQEHDAGHAQVPSTDCRNEVEREVDAYKRADDIDKE